MNIHTHDSDGSDGRQRSGRRRPAPLRLAAAHDRGRWEPKMLGTAMTGHPDPYGIFVPDARHHLHVLGPTGTGKSTLLVNLVLADAAAGRGVAVFDPKGDLVRDLLHRLPDAVGDRLVLIDPDERQAPAGLNLFELAGTPERVADQLVGVMAKVFAQHWGPRTDDLARQAVLTLAHLPDATLADLPILLQDKHFRHRVVGRLRKLADPSETRGLLAFWAWYDGLSDGLAAAQTGPLLSRLGAVLTRSFAAQLFSAGASTFRLDEVLDGGVLLVRLPPTLGEDTVKLVGSLLLAALLHAADARVDAAEHERLDCSVVLDEAHAFLHLPVGVDTALATARALHVSLVLAHQHLAQLTPAMVAAIDANARNKLLFKLSPDDARVLAHHTAPYLKPEHLTDREAYGIVCRLVINGRDGTPFTLATQPAAPPVPGRADQLRAAARTRELSMAERSLRPDTCGPTYWTGPTHWKEEPDHVHCGRRVGSSSRSSIGSSTAQVRMLNPMLDLRPRVTAGQPACARHSAKGEWSTMTKDSARTAPRARGTPSVSAELSRLTDRDKDLVDMLDEHQVLATQHINAIFFDHPATGRNRLRLLLNREVLHHFRAYVSTGTESWRWTLGYLGHSYIAARDRTSRPRRTTIEQRNDDLAASPRLRHLLGVNGFFVHLRAHARTTGGASLDQWWSENRCVKATGGLARPDGHGRWTESGRTFGFWLEYDRATEDTKAVAAKLDGYQRLHEAARQAGADGLRNAVLIRMQTSRQEQEIHTLVRRHPAVASDALLVATMSGRDGTNPAWPVWTAAAGRHYGPLRLSDLVDQQRR